MSEQKITERLFEIQDPGYKQFHSKLIPTIDPQTIIGVRTPQLRKLAKELADSAEAESFLNSLPHLYYEENNLHGFLLEMIRDYDRCMEKLEEFLPYVDNWATCDMMSPRVFRKYLPELTEKIKEWMTSEHVYAVRFGMNMLMKYYLDEQFRPEYLEWAAAVRSEEYYIQMMVAWFFATALAKQYDAALCYLTERRLAPWVHNKTIQKALESNRISMEQKACLKTLKIRKASV
ncbi:MAG: DNA alkylation repair protein [Lachnospiraceae bacterium]